MSYLVDILKTSSLGRLDFQITLRDCSKEAKAGEARIYRRFCNKDQVVGNIKRLLTKKTRHLKLMDLALFERKVEGLPW